MKKIALSVVVLGLMVASCKKEAEESIEITQNLDMDSPFLEF